MKTLEDAKQIMRLCNASNTDWGKAKSLWCGYACDLCGNCCPECTTPMVLYWVWPELEDYKETVTEKEWKAMEEADRLEREKQMHDYLEERCRKAKEPK